ncbi:alpha-L-rhamnosidase-related protein [Paenibacillus xylanivorans]|nr:sugar hydrolase [Paenibacillus xylanivorans]
MGSVSIIADEQALQGWKVVPDIESDNWCGRTYGKRDSFVLDFGDHLVGYVTLSIQSVGSPQDAPLKLKMTFGEMPCEVAESFDNYNGNISSSWLQEETLYVDVLPAELKLPRRYCFRFLKVEVLDTSRRYQVMFNQASCTTVSSGDDARVEPLPANVPEDIRMMDYIAVKTLRNCMQTVFEDGPKRDRRLWVGDLRLQAQANYYTFKNYDLVKRCLYLFGGMRLEDGTVGACVYEKPNPQVDDINLYDYALLFVACLHDYYEASTDLSTLEELWPIAMEQLEIGLARLDVRGIVRDDSTWWSFTDWQDGLNKQTPAQAVLIYCLRRGKELAGILGLDKERHYIESKIELTVKAALEHLWDDTQCLFVSGETMQISWASQVWMVLAEVMPQEVNRSLMDRVFEQPPSIGMTTPYMYHHFIEALILAGNYDQAVSQIRAYWGGMVKDGADTFWELYNPADKKLSPYGSFLINSYCHAWSCTPAYFIRKYML